MQQMLILPVANVTINLQHGNHGETYNLLVFSLYL